MGAGCSREGGQQPEGGAAATGERGDEAPIVTVAPEQEVAPVPEWKVPEAPVDGAEADLEETKAAAAEALESGELFREADDAIPLYLALREEAPADREVQEGLDRSMSLLLEQGTRAIERMDLEPAALRDAQEVGAVVRAVATDDREAAAFLERLEVAERASAENRRGEQALNAGRIDGGENSAIARFRAALGIRPGDARAMQGLAAAESALIREAEERAANDDYAGAVEWLDRAAQVRPGMETVDDARLRIQRQRGARVGALRDLGIAALGREDGIDTAREHLATLLRIAPAGDAAAVQLRERIELATHYGLFRPGQAFTEAMASGGRGPEMVVIPHGAFRMGAAPDEQEATDAERPARNIRFDRGLAVSRHEVTVGEFRRFVSSSGHVPRSTRRGHSIVYDERSGNLVRRSGVDWQSDYVGKPAPDDMPVIHVSAQDAAAYAEWLSSQTGHHYRLPSEAEFEYMLRAGSQSTYPWGGGAPPEGAGNFTGSDDVSPSGRRWRNAFEDYGDGAWGPAPVESYSANAFGLHDVAGNVSEWVSDCWHDSYRRAPADGKAWINPGCRTKVVRGGSWASSPQQTRSAWRIASESDTTNARIGFRVVRDI